MRYRNSNTTEELLSSTSDGRKMTEDDRRMQWTRALKTEPKHAHTHTGVVSARCCPGSGVLAAAVCQCPKWYSRKTLRAKFDKNTKSPKNKSNPSERTKERSNESGDREIQTRTRAHNTRRRHNLKCAAEFFRQTNQDVVVVLFRCDVKKKKNRACVYALSHLVSHARSLSLSLAQKPHYTRVVSRSCSNYPCI